MKEFIRENSCKLSHAGGEQYGRTFSSSTADGINYATNGLIEDKKSDVAHGLMWAGLGSAVLSTTNSSWIVVFVVLIILVALFWSLGQNDEAVRNIPGRERCDLAGVRL